MERACGLLTLTLVAVVVGVGPRAIAQDTPPATALKLGVLSGMFRDVPPALVQAVADPFRQIFKKHTGLGGDVEVIDDFDTLAAKLNDKKLQLGVFHGFEWAWVRDRYPDLRPLVVTVPPKKLQPCLVVHTDSKVTTAAGLRGAQVVIPLGVKAHGYLYIERLKAGLPAGTFEVKRHKTWGPEQALDAVAAEDAPAALVDAAALSAYQNNKPGAATQLKVLCQSEAFPPTVIAYHKDGVDQKTVEKVRGGLLNTHKDPQGRAFLVLWNLKGFEDVPAGYEADLVRTLKAYPRP